MSKVFDVYLRWLRAGQTPWCPRCLTCIWCCLFGKRARIEKLCFLNYLHSLLTHLCAYTQHTLRTYSLTMKGMCVCVLCFSSVCLYLPAFLLCGHFCGYSHHTLRTYGFTKKGICGCRCSSVCLYLYAFLLFGHLCGYSQHTSDTVSYTHLTLPTIYSV